MKISNFRYEVGDGFFEISAKYVWEDNEREDQEIYFRYSGSVNETYFNLDTIAQPFLIAAIVPALRRGERSISIVDADICPWLKDNLSTFMRYLVDWYWYKYDRNPGDKWIPNIECESSTVNVPEHRRTASFFSGGVDSLYSIMRNHNNIPIDHPGRVEDVIFVHGFDMGNRPDRGTEEAFYSSVVRSMGLVLETEKLNLISAYTNIRSLDPYTDCWLDEYMGSAMSAVAHGLTGQLTDVLIASSYEIGTLHPFASHPVIEPRLSSYAMRVHHDGESFSRVDRVRMISTWPEAMSSLRVCFYGDEDGLNCGMCPKCIRTKLELICAGKLAEAVTMKGGEPSPKQVRSNMEVQHDTSMFMPTLARELRRGGRADLSWSVLFCYQKYMLKHWLNPVTILKAIDENVLSGRLKRHLSTFREK